MRRLLFFIGLFAGSLQVFAQSKQEQQRIQAPLLRFFEAMSAQQADALKAELTPDFALLENGKVWNTDSLTISMSRYQGLGIKRINQLDFVSTEQIGNMSLVTYHNRADITYNGRQFILKWLESAVLIKENGQWKIKVLHSTEIKPAAARPEKS
jgi:ketosteroid isomerase-like protein